MWMSVAMNVTIATIIALSVSYRSAQSTRKPSTSIQVPRETVPGTTSSVRNGRKLADPAQAAITMQRIVTA